MGSQPRARSFSLQYAQLLAQRKDLQAQAVTGTEEGVEQREQADEKPNHRPAFIAQASAASSGQLLEFKASRSIGDGRPSILYFLLIAGCQQVRIAPLNEATLAEFERLYFAWHQEAEAIRFSSNTYDYIRLPSYRKIVALGRAALPALEQKMKEDKGLDFMLAFAVIEICGWDRREFRAGSEQELRDQVLRKLRQK